jgi:anti-sigma regulatory factor (Ser/Thr protein kinase)
VSPASVVLSADSTAPSAARAFVRQHMPDGELRSRLPTAELLVSELVTNAVRYGKGESIRVAVDQGDRRLVVSVSDSNPALPQRRDDEDAYGGRGIVLVDALASGWGAEESGDGKTVWFALDVR